MARTSIIADEKVLQRLRRLAAERGVSLGQIIREALNEKVEREQPPLSFLATGDDLASNDRSARRADEEDLYQPDPHRSR